jgi:putative chitobiose transport system permease protein
MNGRASRWLTPYLFLLPAAVVLGTFVLYPMVRVIGYSFSRSTPFLAPEGVGLANYEAILGSGRFWNAALNSAAYLLVTPIIIVLSLSAAMVIESGIRGRQWLRLMLFIPVITPTVVAALAWRLLFGEEDGLINQALGAIGIDPIAWLTQRPWTLVTAMTVTVWKGFGFYMMVFVAALLSVPKELKEAAVLDGAGRFGVFRLVVLPAVWPSIVLVFVVSSIAALKVFDELFVTVKGVPLEHQTVVPLIYEEAFGRGNFGMASAMGVILFLLILGFSFMNLKLSLSRQKPADQAGPGAPAGAGGKH